MARTNRVLEKTSSVLSRSASSRTFMYAPRPSSLGPGPKGLVRWDLGWSEQQLILNCARVELDGLRLEQTEELLEQSLNWTAILAFSEFHSVAPLIFHTLKRIGGLERIPREANRGFLRLFHRAAYQNQKYREALLSLLAAFYRASVPVIVLKGLSLLEVVYGQPGLRPLIDINLLIPRDKVETARALLSEMAYLENRPGGASTYRWAHSQLLFLKPRPFEVNLLLQWHVVNWPKINAIDLRRIWNEAQTVQISGQEVLMLSPVDLLFYLCIQPDKHGYLNEAATHIEDTATFVFSQWTHNRLIRFCDIYQSARHYGGAVDWQQLVELAKVNALEGAVYRSLSWTGRLFGPVVDSDVLSELHPPQPRYLRKWAFEALAGEPDGRASNRGPRRMFKTWWLRRSGLTQLRFLSLLNLLEFIFPRRNELRARYGLHSDKWTPLCYLRHSASSLFRCIPGFFPWIYRLLFRWADTTRGEDSQ